MPSIEIIAILAVAQYVFFGFLVGQKRAASGPKAPAMSGHDGFERIYRVQMNTLECLVALLPMLFLAGQYWPAALVAPLGLIYLVGRMLYWRAYVSDPSTRTLGFVLSLLPILVLMLMALVGAALALFGMR